MVKKDYDLNKLGPLLRQLRKDKDLSLSKVSKVTGISHNFLSEIERGKKEPSDEKIRVLAELYEIDEDELYMAMNKVPRRTTMYVSEDIELQKILSELQKKYSDNPEKLKEIKRKVTELYRNILEEDD